MRRLVVLSVMALSIGMAPVAAACGTVPGAQRPTATQPAIPSRSSPAPSSAVPSASGSVAPSASTAPPATGQVLAPGMTGQGVLRLQLRLAALKYYPGQADGQFGADTLEAVWAFEEVQGLPPSDQVGRAMQAALAHPRSPAVLVPAGGATRVEISLQREVLVLYRAGQVALISHVSTGGGYYYCSPGGGCGYAITPVGDFQTLSYVPSWVVVPLGEMYNPVFFVGTAYAIHGDTDVPLDPVSHGCVRIPMDVAAFFHTLVKIPGTPVYIRG